MKNLFKRALVTSFNKFQRRLVFPMIGATILICFLCYYLLDYYMLNVLNTHIFSGAPVIFGTRDMFFFLVLGLIFLSSIFSSFWLCAYSNKILGAYQRVLREMDEIIQGRRKGPVTARQGDVMFEELLKRINVFIERSTPGDS